ncbi:MAG TPA: hypothetical protein DCR72_12490 [Pseudomonas sp.]|nr:hypothetical protein [Pseudomonas sp.]
MHRLILWGQGNGGNTYPELSLSQLELRQGLPPAALGETHSVPYQYTSSSGFQGQIDCSPDQTKLVLTTGVSGNGKLMVCRDGGEHGLFDTVEVPLAVFSGTVECVTASNEYFAVGGASSSYVMLYDWATLTAQNLPVTGIGSTVRHLAFSPDGRYLAVLSNSGFYLRLYDLQAPGFTYIDVSSAARPSGSSSSRMAWSENGKLFVTGSTSSPYLSVYDTTLERIHQITTASIAYSGQAIVSLAGKNKMAVGCWTNSSSYPLAYLIDIETYAVTPLPKLRTHEGSEVSCIAWSLAYDQVAELLYLNHEAILAAGGATAANMSRLDINNIPAGWETFFTGEVRRDTRGIWNMLIVSRERGQISGTVRNIENLPVQRTVRAFNRASGHLMAQTVSDPITGNYTLRLPNLEPVDVVFQAEDGELLNDLFFANAQPEPVT